MSASYCVKPAEANNQVWNILDASGNQIGACSSRRDALRIAALVKDGAKVREELRGGTPTTSRNVIEESDKTVLLQTLKLYQNQPHRSATAWSLIRKYFTYMRAMVHKIAARKAQ